MSALLVGGVTLALGSISSPAEADDARFADVAAEDDHATNIGRIAEAGITRGCDPPDNERFCPERTVTRAEMASFLARALDLPQVDDRPFADTSGSSHEAQIAAIADAGITRGCNPPDNDRFCPDRDITRAEMATFLARAFGFASSPIEYFDEGGTHRDNVNAITDAGITAGCNELGTEFCPELDLPREQMAAFLARATDLSPRLDSPEHFEWDVSELSAAQRDAMTGTSWEPGCPVPLDDLRAIELNHRDFDGEVVDGLLIAHADVVTDLEAAFDTIFRTGFPLEAVVPAYEFEGDDDAIMAANASHAFNCREITGGSSWSEHSFGTAIDLNPRQNPYERDGTVLPPEGSDYLDRSNVRPGMLIDGDPVISEFDGLGWDWGGRWTSLVDYMHLEKPR